MDMPRLRVQEHAMKDIYTLLDEIGLVRHFDCDSTCVGKRFELDACIELLEYFRDLIRGEYESEPEI